MNKINRYSLLGVLAVQVKDLHLVMGTEQLLAMVMTYLVRQQLMVTNIGCTIMPDIEKISLLLVDMPLDVFKNQSNKLV